MTSHVRRSRLLLAGALVLVLAAGALPYLDYLPLRPTSRDAAVWMTRAAPSNPDWLRWVLAEDHLTRCYRPVAALTYSLDYGLGRFSAFPYRLTDLAFHLGSALLVYFLYRRLAPRLSPWGGVAATAAFLAHPVGQLIVPSLSRRSYSLCTLLGLGALLLLAPTGRPGHPSRPAFRAALAALLMTCAVLSNELGVTLVFAAGLVLLHGALDDRGRRAWSIGAGAAIAVGVLIVFVLRSLVMGGLGGYPEETKDVGGAAISVWQTLSGWRSVKSSPGRILFVAGSIIVGFFYLRTVARSGLRNVDGRLPALCVGWLSGFTAVAASVGVWFPREAYVALPPFALLLGSALALSMRHFDGRRPRAWLALAPQLLAAGWLLTWSVTVTWVSAQRFVRHQKTDALLRDLHDDLASYPRPALVALVLPLYGRGGSGYGQRPDPRGRHPEIWINGLLHDRPITVEVKLSYLQNPRSDPDPPEMTVADGVIEFSLPPEARYSVPGSERGMPTREGRDIVRFRPADDDRDQLLYFHDGRSGRLVSFDAASPTGGAE